MWVSLSYTRGVWGDKWRSGGRKAAFPPGPPLTSRAVRESDRRSLSFSCSLSKTMLEKVEPVLKLFCFQRNLEDQIEGLSMFHFNRTRQTPLLFSLRPSDAEKDSNSFS